MATVLCTNGMLSKTLAVVRSLGKQGIDVIVSEKTRYHTSGFSKYARKTLINPDPKEEPERFYRWLLETIEREKCDFVFPMDDDVMDIVAAHRDELSALCAIPVPGLESYRAAADKSLTMRLAKRLEVPHPRTAETAFGASFDAETLLKLTEEMTYPFVIKPRAGSGSRGVRFVRTSEELVDTFRQIHLLYPNPIVQEAIPYAGKYGVCLCYGADHALKASFIHKQLRNFPHEKGPSVVRESVHHEELLSHTVRLMDGIPWYGVVEVEYIVDSRTGEPKLLEINPRYWASLHLAVECGIDFPFLQYELGMGKDPAPMTEYADGIRGRQLLPGDTLYFLTEKNRWKMDPPYFTTGLRDDILSKTDFMPTIGFLISALRYCFDIKMWRFLLTR